MARWRSAAGASWRSGRGARSRPPGAPTRRIDAAGGLVSPGLVDPHSHLIFAGDRSAEYEEKILGRIVGPHLERGIGVTLKATRAASDEALVAQALRDLDLMLAHGTTTLEAKTGYGLDRASELRLLRLTAGLAHAVEVVPTFLGAHVVPEDYAGRREAYVELLIAMTPEVARLAEYCDVSCDPSCFTADECRRMGAAARAHGHGHPGPCRSDRRCRRRGARGRARRGLRRSSRPRQRRRACGRWRRPAPRRSSCRRSPSI